MYPDFSKKTVDTLGKRAGYRCSNPDCRKQTVGPNTDPTKSTLIGEAAHIFGARERSKRYQADMSDFSRAEITNAIWLCSNCHKLIDTDEHRYTSDVIFQWRENHERYILKELGGETDKIHQEKQDISLSKFKEYTPIIRRIIIDKPDGWEWRLASELLRTLNTPLFRKINDLKTGLYVKSYSHLSEEKLRNWVIERLSEASKLITPLVNLIESLNHSFGQPGESGSTEEIHHVCILINSHLEQIILFEETLYFTIVPDRHEKLLSLLKDSLSSQAQKIQEIPDTLDYVVSLLGTDHGGTKETPRAVHKKITFELPPGWEASMKRELKKLELG